MLLVQTVVALSLFSQVPASSPALRLAVVDDSGSMRGAKITLVQKELVRMVDTNPPSSNSPFAIIVFGDRARPAQMYHSTSSAKAAIRALSGSSGGTRIAAGLEQAVADLKRFSSFNVHVYFFSDGVDPDKGAIARAEAKLDNLFRSRKQHGLSQSVYLKQWGAGSLDSLAKTLRASGSADVVDGDKEIKLPVTLSPKVTIETVQRLEDQRRLAITWNATIKASGTIAGAPRVAIRCNATGLSGDTECVATTGRLTNQTMELLQAGEDLDERQFLLTFEADLVQAGAVNAGLQTRVSPAKWEVPVTAPVPEIRNAIVATLQMDEAPKWIDPLAVRAVYPVTLRFDVTAADPTKKMDRSSSFRIVPADGCRLVSDKETFTLAGPGQYSVPLVFEASLNNPGAQREDLRFTLGFTVKPVNVPPHLTFMPPQVEFTEDDLRAPDPVFRTVTVRPVAVTPPRWIALSGVFGFKTRAVWKADGPIPPDSRIQTSVKGPVRQIKLTEDSFSTKGPLTLRIAADARLPSTKTPIEVGLTFVHDGTTGVEVRPATIQFGMKSPPPMALSIADQTGNPSSLFQLTMRDDRDEAPLTIVPRVQGLPNNQIRSLTVDMLLGTGGTMARLPLGEPSSVPIRPPERERPSFFFDETQDIPMVMRTSAPFPIVSESTAKIRVRHVAPFKRILVPLSISLAALGIAFLVCRTAYTLRCEDDTPAGKS